MLWDKVKSSEDLDQLIEFEKAVQPEKDCLTIDEYTSWIGAGLEITILRESSGDIIGSYQIIKGSEGDTLFAGFGRHPDYKGKGVGQNFMNRIITRPKIGALICETRHDNHNMIRLLKVNGFEFTNDEFKDDEHWTWWKRF